MAYAPWNKRKTRRTIDQNFSMNTPIFFKLWFGFLFCVILLVWVTIGYGIYTVVSDPAVIGRVAGEVVSGFNEKVK